MLHLPRLFAMGVPWVLLTACVTDPKVENDVPAQAGAEQPGGGGSPVALAEACSRVRDAQRSARATLQCDAPADEPSCPAGLAVAGTLLCDEYDEDSVTACVTATGRYTGCRDFDTRPCVITAIASSCHAPGPGGSGTDASLPPDASLGSDARAPDSSVEHTDAGGPSNDGSGGDAGPDDAGKDGR